jgi:hypothetical protein
MHSAEKSKELTFPLRLEIRKQRGFPHFQACCYEHYYFHPGLRGKSMRE